MKRRLLMSSVLTLCACSVPAKVELPPSQELQAAHRAGNTLAGQPLPPRRIRPGDTLRIVRNTGEAPSISAFTANSIYELTLFTVLYDGTKAAPVAVTPITTASRTSFAATSISACSAPGSRGSAGHSVAPAARACVTSNPNGNFSAPRACCNGQGRCCAMQ